MNNCVLFRFVADEIFLIFLFAVSILISILNALCVSKALSDFEMEEMKSSTVESYLQ